MSGLHSIAPWIRAEPVVSQDQAVRTTADFCKRSSLVIKRADPRIVLATISGSQVLATRSMSPRHSALNRPAGMVRFVMVTVI